MPRLFYTIGGNPGLAAMTAAEDWDVGIRSDRPVSKGIKVSFIDIEYRAPDFARHLAMIQDHAPLFAAVVPDLSDQYVDGKDMARALRQADQLQRYCERVIIVPKLSGQLPYIPHCFTIGYSLPTSNGAAQYGVWKLEGRDVHLLGGSPHRQMRLYQHMKSYCNVVSVDGNMIQKVAFSFCKYWEYKKRGWAYHPLKDTGEETLAPQCIQWSLQNIKKAWHDLTTPQATPTLF